jgi:excisionase family DNA binding protein
MEKTITQLKVKTLPAIMGINEMAAYLGLSPVTIIKKTEKGLIPAFKIGRKWKFRADTIEKWITQQEETEKFKRLTFAGRVDFVGTKIREGFKKAGYRQMDLPGLIAEIRYGKQKVKSSA